MRFTILDDRSSGGSSRTAGRVPVDLVAAAAFVALAAALVFESAVDGAGRTLVALPLVLFLPGYALLTVLFPRRGADDAGLDWRRPAAVAGRRIDWPERLSLSFGVSVALVPPFALTLATLGVPLTARTVVGGLAGVVLAAMAAGTVRRWRVAPGERYRVPVRRWLSGVRTALRTRSRRRAALDLLLAVSVVAASAGLAYAVAVPHDGGSYTDATLLTEDDSGEYVAGGYPTDLAAGEPVELVLGVENHEGERTDYAAVVVLERVDGADATVREAAEVTRLEVTVADGEAVRVPHEVAPAMTGEDLRLSYYLYRGDAPADPSAETAYRHLYLWVTVSS